jgi:glycosyltransferase involved in cell wall biosynthesis
MRVGFICNEYPPAPHGGIGTFVQTMAHHLGKLKQEIIVIGYDPFIAKTRWLEENGTRVLRIRSPFHSFPEIRLGRYDLNPAFLGERIYLSCVLARIAKEERLDLVESYDWSGPLWTKPSVPLVVRLHGANTAYQFYEKRQPSKLLRFAERRNVSISDSLVGVSRHIGGMTLKALGLSKRTFEVIYNGVDTEVFHPSISKKDPLEVLYVGSLTRRKGIFSLFRAIPSVLSQVPGAHFKIVGRLPEGESGRKIREDLLALIPERVTSSIYFSDFVPHRHLPLIYGQAAVAIFPSYAEAFGLTCAEAMACGTAVVMTSRASGPELIEHQISGLLADPDDPDELAQAIITLLENVELRKTLENNARKRAVDLFDIRALAQKNLRFYEELIDGQN